MPTLADRFAVARRLTRKEKRSLKRDPKDSAPDDDLENEILARARLRDTFRSDKPADADYGLLPVFSTPEARQAPRPSTKLTVPSFYAKRVKAFGLADTDTERRIERVTERFDAWRRAHAYAPETACSVSSAPTEHDPAHMLRIVAEADAKRQAERDAIAREYRLAALLVELCQADYAEHCRSAT